MKQKKVIMIVEDDIEMRSILKLYLTNIGYNIIVADNGDDAYEKIRHNTPDLILSDIMMPGTDGIDLRNKLLKNPEYRIIPFIFVSALGKIEEKIKGLKLFVDDYIVKPFDMAELVVRIQSTIKRSEYFNDLIKIDSLTKLYNRKTFFKELEKEIKRVSRYNTQMSVAIIDLDYFKKCNDTYGHVFGDSVLIKVSEFLLSSLRETDFAGRFGGEEFLVAMPETDKEGAKIVIERFRKSVQEMEFEIPGFRITFSAGIATIPEDGNEGDDIVRTADIALYKAKNNGRNRVEVFDASLQSNITIV
ncbi:MAG: diguanylate cyclase [Calditrichae bacterium]|nr:diguanylate cyclase [Calditrichota bacterium]MCB9058988.1 diguanylate cyclase [Calditrichia bacterium]